MAWESEERDEGGPSRHWHLQMLTYSLLCLGHDSSASERLTSKASSLRAQLEHGLKEIVYNLFSWVREQPERDLDGLMEERQLRQTGIDPEPGQIELHNSRETSLHAVVKLLVCQPRSAKV